MEPQRNGGNGELQITISGDAEIVIVPIACGEGSASPMMDHLPIRCSEFRQNWMVFSFWASGIAEGSRVQGFKGSSEMLKNYKELKVWQKSYALCLTVYAITAKFPKEEK